MNQSLHRKRCETLDRPKPKGARPPLSRSVNSEVSSFFCGCLLHINTNHFLFASVDIFGPGRLVNATDVSRV